MTTSDLTAEILAQLHRARQPASVPMTVARPARRRRPPGAARQPDSSTGGLFTLFAADHLAEAPEERTEPLERTSAPRGLTEGKWASIPGCSPRSSGTNTLQRTTCQECHRPVLRTLWAENVSSVLVLDPTPLTPLGEARALLAGLTCVWWYLAADVNKHIHRMASYRDDPTRNVVAQHRCQPGPWLDTPAPDRVPQRMTPEELPELPPF